MRCGLVSASTVIYARVPHSYFTASANTAAFLVRFPDEYALDKSCPSPPRLGDSLRTFLANAALQLTTEGDKLLVATATKGLCLVPTDDLDLSRAEMFGET